MNDDGLSMSGWLFADLVLVLALVFLAIVPGDPIRAAATPTPTASPTPVDSPRCLPQSNFQFDQVVVSDVSDVRIDAATWEKIVAGRVRVNLTKAQESGLVGPATEYSPLLAGPYLAKREADGFRIALIETFNWMPQNVNSTDLSKEVNRVLVNGIREQKVAGLTTRVFFYPTTDSAQWSIDYLDHTINENSVRINLFFVRELPAECRK